MHLRRWFGLATLATTMVAAAALALPSLSSATPNIVAGPITDPATGATFYLVGNTDWYTAEAEAEQLGGHLATDVDPTEDQWIRDNIAQQPAGFFDSPDVWIGLTDQANEGQFIWVSGASTPAWDASVFDTPFYGAFPWRNSGEPNGGTSENCVYFDLDPRPNGGWVDFPCSGSDPLLGLVEIDSSPVNQPQQITLTTTPSNPVVGTTYTVGATGGGSGIAVQFGIDLSSTPGTCSNSGSAITFSAVGTCVIDANQGGGPGYDPAPQVQQTITVGKGTPSVTWSPASLPFGAPLAAAQLDAAANTAGSFAYSPDTGAILEPGTQTLAATFTPTDTADWNTVEATAQVNVTTTVPPITTSTAGKLTVAPGGSAAITGGTVSGPVTVSAGGSLFVGPGASISGPLTIATGVTLAVQGGVITGPVKATANANLTLCGATITGPFSVDRDTGPLVVGSMTGCAGNTITGPVSVTDGSGGVSFVGNRVTGGVTITGNTGGFSFSDNSINGKSTIKGNT
jgi:hypothetical protein